MKKSILVDIDGTLADCGHRRHHVVNKPKNWKAWNEGMHLDSPNAPVIEVVRALAKDNIVLLVTGREEAYREVTSRWLRNVADIHWTAMWMRATKDYRNDDIVKGELLDQILAEGFKPWLALDDRNRCINLWRARGLTALQVAEGDF